MTILVLLLVLAITLYVAVGRRTAKEREALGLQYGSIVAADDARIGSPTLRSKHLGLVGRPDHVLRSGGVFIPVEQKPHSTRLQPSHALQIAAQCLLVEEIYRVRPPYGVVVLAGGRQAHVAFTPDLERRLLDTMREMREFLVGGREPGRRWVDYKCRACGFRTTCWK
jgi:CRISPR-associated exonuclease Cas4